MLRRKTLVFPLITCCVFSSFVFGNSGTRPMRVSQPQSATQTRKPTRRALLVGIDNYERDPEFQSVKCQEPVVRKSSPRRRPATSRGGFGGFVRLEGPVDDVCGLRQLLIAGYGFAAQNVHVVQDKDATHDGILSAFRRYLIDEAAPGDVCLFFYSGHGSQVKNSLGSEADQLDETLVPFDWNRPIEKREDAKDIRDKEIFKLFKEAARKVTLTALFDSCHSGDIARGGVSEERAKTGDAEMKFDFLEPPDEAQKGVSDDKYLEDSGVLVLSAARDFEEAKEKEFNGQWHGNFTYSLIEVLRAPNARNLSAARIFEKLVVQMKSHKASHEPVIVGSVTRRLRTLFGEQVDLDKRPEVNVESIDSTGKISLQGGRALGFHQNCEFIRKGEGGKEVRIRITEEPDYVKSVAEIVARDPVEAKRIAASIKPNDTFMLDKWAVVGEPDLIVWMPPAKFTVTQLKTIAGEIEKLSQSPGIRFVSDPTAELATHYLFYDGVNWILKLPGSETVTVGEALTTNAVLNALKSGSGEAKLFVSLPPSTELATRIKLGSGTSNSAVGWAKTQGDADYLLIGRARPEGATTRLEYAWLLPEATTGVAKAGEPNNAALRRTGAPVSPLPPITDWKTESKDLEDLALRLSKIAGWVKLDSPQGAGGRFAYRLVLKTSKGELLSGANATLSEGDVFSISLVADESLLQPPIEQRHVYILTIDQFGRSALLYPNLRNPDTQIPDQRSPAIVREISLGQVKVCGPDPKKSGCRNPGVLGAETYVMLTTTEPLPDPSVLQGDGVRTPQELEQEKRSKGVRGADSPLTNLLTGIGSTARSGESVVPLNWSVQQVFLNSVPKP